MGDELIWYDGNVIGWIIFGGYVYYVEKFLVQGYVLVGMVDNIVNGVFEIEIFGEFCKVMFIFELLFDFKVECMCMQFGQF